MPKPYYYNDPPQQFDPALNPYNKFKSLKKYRIYQKINTSRFMSDCPTELEEAADRIIACDIYRPCGSPACMICNWHYLRWHGSAIEACSAKRKPKATKFVTVFYKRIKVGKLNSYDIKTCHIRIKARIKRCGLGKTVIIGGVEIELREKDGYWLVHLHMAMFDPPEKRLKRFQKICNKKYNGKGHGCVIEEVDDISEFSTYFQKKMFWHRINYRKGKSRERPAQLPLERFFELASFLGNHTFENFAFLGACRRKDTEIRPLYS